MRRFLYLVLLWCLAATGLHAADPAFDLTGPKVDVHVKRGEVTLPIGEVPNLLPGDRLWIHPDLPESQSTRFILIVAFLRGAPILRRRSGLRGLRPGAGRRGAKASS